MITAPGPTILFLALPRPVGHFKANVMTMIAILVPSFIFLQRGKLIIAIVCMVLQITLIGWIPATIWALISLQQERAGQRNDKLLRALRSR
jgi:uncharacterized membrane protein YqaE (UPF0057 family)